MLAPWKMDGGMVVSSPVQEPVCVQLPFQPAGPRPQRKCDGRNQVWPPKRHSRPAHGTYNSADSLLLACHGHGSIYPTDHAGRSRKERRDLQTQTTSAGQQGSRPLLVGCCCEGLGTRGSWGAAASQPASFHLGRAAARSGGRRSQESSSNVGSTVARTSSQTAPIKLSLLSSRLAHGLLLSFL